MKKIKLFIILAAAATFVGCSNDEPQIVEEETPVEEVTPIEKTPGFELTDTESRAAQETAAFDEAFFKAVCAAEANEDVVVVSPLSARILLAMVANAANEEAAAEITTALGCTDLKALNTLSGKYLNSLGSVDPTATIQMANAVWYHNAYTLADTFKDVIDSDFGSETHAADLYTFNTMDLINGWVAEKTNDKIPFILDAPLCEPVKAVLANALHFAGLWAVPFDEAQTKKDVFKGVSGEKSVNMMYNNDVQLYYESSTCTAIRMEFGAEGKLVATFVLPRAYMDVNKFVSKFSLAEMEEMSTIRPVKTELYLPVFKLAPDKEYELNRPLADLGITKINDMLPSSMFTSSMPAKFDIKQKATIEVNEKGAEGAAASYIIWSSGPHEPEIKEVKFDRPFVMYISHPETGAILLAARIGSL